MLRRLIWLLLVVASASVCHATNAVYVAQTLAGGNTGADCADAKAVTYFNTSGNWSATPSGIQIGPDTTVHLCGTFTGTSNTTMLTFQGSGTSGHPVILIFETAATLTAPYWASSVGGTSAGAITCGTKNYIVINGNNTGIIENTANGSGLANQQASTGISCFGSNNVIENLTIENLYVQVSPSATLGDNSTVRAIDVTGQNVTISGNLIHDCGWCIFDSYNASDTNLQVLNNQIYNMGHGVAFAAASAVACTSPCLVMTGNHIHDAANWTSTGCAFHQDGLHLFGVSGSSMDGVTVANNTFDGDWGTCPTGFVFVEAGGGGSPAGLKNSTWYNNVMIVVNASFVNTNGWFGVSSGTSGSQLIANNTIVGLNATDNTLCFNMQNLSSVRFTNNIASPCGDPVQISSSTLSQTDYNYYGPSCNNGSNCFIWNGAFKGSFPAWRTACGCDSHGIQNSTQYLNANGTLQGTFPGISAALNLISLGITGLDSDILGITRPVSNAWGMGAFQFVGTYYISPSGNDSNPGTLSSPWLTFTHAIPLLNPGYTLVLETGTYTATNVFPSINCSTTAQNGSAPAPITLIAQSQRKAWIDGDGSAVPFQLQNCSYWTISGLHVSDANNASLSESYTFGVINSSNIKLIYNLVDHTNQLVNEHALGLQGTCNSLVQYNEVYYFHRHAFIDYQNSCTSGNGNEWQQNYSNARGWGSGSTVGNGNGFMAYGSQYSLFENNISENNALGAGMDTEAISGSNNVAHVQFLGVVSLSDNQGMGGAAHQSGTCPNNITYTNDAVVTPVEIGWEPRGVQSLSLTNTSLFPTSGVINNYFQDANNFSGCTPSGTVTNSDILSGNSVTGYNNALDGSCAPGSCTLGTLTLNYDGYFGSGSYSANATVTHQFSTNPALGTCYLWVPLASPAKGAGLSGADIGATVLYAYSGGNPTSTPLWNSSGQLISAGAKVTGLNDQAGSSLFDVGARLHINQGGCSFPAGYLPGPAPTAPNNFSIAQGSLQSSGRIGH